MKRRILCLILVFATLCSFNLTMAFADTRNNQISKSYIGRFRSGWDELTIYDISGNKIRFHVFSTGCMTNTVRLRWLRMVRHTFRRLLVEVFPASSSLSAGVSY